MPQEKRLLDIFVMSIFFVSAGRIAHFGKGPLQIHFINALAERERQQMAASKEDTNRITTTDRVINKLSAGDTGNATSGNQQ